MTPQLQFDALALHAATVDSAEIVRWIEAKAPREIGDWNSIGGAEYARSFAVAGTIGHDVIADIYAAMLDTIRMGGTERDFSEMVRPILVSRGWLSGSGDAAGARLQLIYDTNLRVARSIGRWQRVQDVAGVMPYLLGKTVGDRRVRDEHTAFEGVCLPVNHWFWTKFWPPLFFRCRCDVIQLTRSQFARRGLVLTTEQETQTRAQIIAPQAWGYNPALVHSRVMADKIAQTNGNRLPGSGALSADQFNDQGAARWQGVMGLAIQELLAGLATALGD